MEWILVWFGVVYALIGIMMVGVYVGGPNFKKDGLFDKAVISIVSFFLWPVVLMLGVGISIGNERKR